MKEQTQHFQSVAVAIFAVASAALGFGLLQKAIAVPTDLNTSFNNLLDIAIVIFGLASTASYLMVVLSLRKILVRGAGVTGKDVVEGPLHWVVLEILYLIFIFICDALEGVG